MAARRDVMAKPTAMRSTQGTPGRRVRPGNQYFEVGKVGRKTGITLADTGIRDDYGLEPVSGIFSSPASVQRRAQFDEGSTEMAGLDSSIPDVREILQARKTPRLPPARASTPRRSNISGSPRRQSSARPQNRNATDVSPSATLTKLPANRKLEFSRQGVRESIEKRSPFKPTHNLRRSIYGENQDSGIGGAQVRESGNVASPAGVADTPSSSRSKKRVTIEQPRQKSQSTQPFLFDYSDDDENEPFPFNDDEAHYATGEEIEGALGLAGSLLQQSPTTPRRRTSQGVHNPRNDLRRNEGPSSSRAPQLTSSPPSSRKRPRATIANEEASTNLNSRQAPNGVALQASPSSAKKRARIEFAKEPAPMIDYDEPEIDEYTDDGGDLIEEPVENGHSNQFTSPVRATKGRPGRRKGSTRPRKSRPAASRQPKSHLADAVTDSDSDSNNSDYVPRRRQGSVSNVSLRAMTPFEDAGERKTRSGRPVMKPLNYWAGETVVWKHGEVDGVIRASSIEPQKRVYKKRAPAKKKAATKRNALGAIDEADEELLPSDWEEEVGVLTGEVAVYDPNTGMGNDEHLEVEDIAFAASAIITRQVQGASFNYAKIQTLSFFGSGIVEIPPGGVKATKNSRKMQMNFFMHKGKVQVTVTTPRVLDGGEPLSTIEFGITEGGAWIVPRGNNYTIRNLSTTITSYIFFSQGCEVEEGTA